ncbi:hypothetical protein C9374_006392 [Naegleria lovaniensis]|uniref:Uncharacterized protein n=1 Tax=Naegleria lovaniensis TaxID=51637 RepID=A0AA88GNQ7_NAELO|nr:uncharacterized protein C9374_006392 [Naegleria lovaniensis]KAG2381403.1 hypothetical protein C9374_006392 [Naegleria lovaniensis]
MSYTLHSHQTLLQNIRECMELCQQVIEPTLGPLGMDMAIFSQHQHSNQCISNDGATLLKTIPMESASCILLSRISLLQDKLIGDGTTSVVIFSCELLNQARYLIENRNIHPSLIIRGYQIATEKCKEWLKAYVLNSNDDESIKSLIRTSMQSKIISQYENTFVELLFNVFKEKREQFNVHPSKEFNLFFFSSIGNDMNKTSIFNGIIIDNLSNVNHSQLVLNDVKVLMCKSEELNGTFVNRIFNTKMNLDSSEASQVDYKNIIKICDQLIEMNIGAVFNVGIGIHKVAQEYLKEKGIFCAGFLDFNNAQKLAVIANCVITSSLKNPKSCGCISKLTVASNDSSSSIEIIQNDKHSHPKYIWNSIRIVGPSVEICNEIHRSIHDCMSVLNISREGPLGICPGGGATFMYLSKCIRKLSYPNNLQLILEAYANALEIIPVVLSRNMGYDSSNVLSQLRSTTLSHMGVDSNDEGICNQLENQVIEPVQLIVSILERSLEFNEMILRIDENVYIKPYQSDVARK